MRRRSIEELGGSKDSNIKALVGLLREINAGRQENDLQRNPGDCSSSVPTGLLGQLAELMQATSPASFQRQPDLGADVLDAVDILGDLVYRGIRTALPPIALPEKGSRYEAMRQSIRGIEASLAERNEWIEQNTRCRADCGPGPAGPMPLLQETIYLQCARAGRTAGRFRCINRTGERGSLSTRVGALRSPNAEVIEAAQLSIHPAELILEADEAAVMTASVDLRRCPACPDDEIEGSLDIQIDGACTQKMWIMIGLYDAIA